MRERYAIILQVQGQCGLPAIRASENPVLRLDAAECYVLAACWLRTV